MSSCTNLFARWYCPLQPIVNSLTKGGILAWKSPTSNSIANNKKLLSVVKLMEEEVPRSQLHLINLNEKNQDERFQAVIAAFDETGQVLHTHAKKSGDARLWLTKRHAQDLKSLIETDYQQATGLDMTQCKLYISEISLVYGGSAVQTVHNDDDTLDIPNFQQRSGGVGESSTIVYGIKEDKVNRCKIHFAQNNESTNLKMVNVYSGMAVLFSGWVYHAGGDHAGRNASTRLYVDLSKKKRAN